MMMRRFASVCVSGSVLLALTVPALAASAPVDLLPGAMTPQPSQATVAPPPVATPPVMPPPTLPLLPWTLADANALLAAIPGVEARGLLPADYEADALKAAIAAGEGAGLDAIAARIFTKLIVDLRDGRTPYPARVQWFVRDPDAAATPTDALMRIALASHDFETTFNSIEPVHPDYAALKAALAATPASNTAKRDLIRTNMERWRWLPRDLGTRYVYVNVPEYMIRVVGKGKNISTYRAIVGAVKTPTPQLAEMATGMIIYPTWTVPQSIIKGGIAATIANNPARAKAQGYSWTGTGKNLSVVQAFGPTNSLGSMKLDMPNPHAIFLHDTPAKGLFARPVRALSHGCVRTDRAIEFAILMSILQAGVQSGDAATVFKRETNDRIPFIDPVPVYINYFTLASSGDGKLAPFPDIYGRDAPVVASFAKPREEKIVVTPVKEVPIEAPGA